MTTNPETSKEIDDIVEWLGGALDETIRHLPEGMCEVMIPKSIIRMYTLAAYEGSQEQMKVYYYDDA